MDANLDDTILRANQEPPTCHIRQPSCSRMTAAQVLEQFDQLDSPGNSCRQIARGLQLSDSTLRYWLRQRRNLCRNSPWPPEVVRFFESPAGLLCLHQLLAAGHMVFLQANDCGIRSMCWFLHLSGLDCFVASSYGAQHAVAEEMESLVIEFGQQEDRRLAPQMPAREITLCEDETFHPQICLVATEPVSNFILVEQYETRRDAETWNRCLDEKLAGLPVTVCQVTSDQAKALITHTEIHLGAHHSPDLFHVQYETVKGTSCALAGQIRQAEGQLQHAQERTAAVGGQLQACTEQCPQSAQRDDLQHQLQQAKAEQAAAGERLSACQNRQQRAAQARQGLGRDYHPFDLETGRPLEAHEVQQRLASHFDTLEQVAAEAGLSKHATEKIAKARRVLKAMQATICFFWAMITVRFWVWNLPEPVQRWMRDQLIPGFYLRRAAEKASSAVERHRLAALSEKILARARSPDGLWSTLSCEAKADLEHKAQLCADYFQRSSSCVEGRNGHLSLKHHALHQLTSRKLKTLTVLHNYLVRRPDGSTAAERFYNGKPRDLFAWLLEHLSLPSRPRAGRCAA